MRDIELGHRLRALRGDMKQVVLARELGIAQSALSMYENGQRVPCERVKHRYAQVFGETVAAIFYPEEKEGVCSDHASDREDRAERDQLCKGGASGSETAAIV